MKTKSDRPKRKPSESLHSRGNHSGEAAVNTASQKRSITLYQTDLDILDEIRNYLLRHGVRNLSDSEALRLACRTIVLNDNLLKTYKAMKLDDGRRKR